MKVILQDGLATFLMVSQQEKINAELKNMFQCAERQTLM